MATAVLAVQGAFAEHEARLAELGETCVELRQASDLRQRFDRLVLPGGESTTQGKLLAELGMLEPLRERIEDGMPVLATCAGLILLARRLDAHDDRSTPRIATLDVLVRRNAYGRQLGSFHAEGRWEDDAETAKTSATTNAKSQPDACDEPAPAPVPLTFIRAPRIEALDPGVEPLVTLNDTPVAVRHHNQIAAAFHPELDPDNRLYEAFLALIAQTRNCDMRNR